MTDDRINPLSDSADIDVKRLRLKPGDIIVVNVDRQITAEEAHRLKERVEQLLVGHQVLVTSCGVTIEIIKPTDD